MNLLLALIFALFVVTGCSPAKTDFKEGKWSMTMVTKMDTSNMPAQMAAMMGNPMTMTMTECVTHQSPVPKQSNGCQETHQINGNTITFSANCDRGNAQNTSQGRLTYNGDSMTGHIDSHLAAGGRTIDSTVDITGQYQGPC